MKQLRISSLSHLGFPGSSVIKNLPARQEMWVPSLGREDPLEEGMTTHSSILARRTPWTEEPGGYIVHGVTKGQTRIKQLSAHTHIHTQSVTSNAQTHSLNTIYKEVDNTLAPCENVFIPWNKTMEARLVTVIPWTPDWLIDKLVILRRAFLLKVSDVPRIP